MEDQNKNRAMSYSERLVRHFQNNGFNDVTEAVVLHVKGSSNLSFEQVSDEFAKADAKKSPIPLSRFFEVRFIECYSDKRTESEIRSQFQQDFEWKLRKNFPELFFEKKNYLFDDKAEKTKYDIAIRIGRKSPEGVVKVVLLNDPGASFVEYFERQSEEVERCAMTDEEVNDQVKAAVGKVALLRI